MLNTYQQQTYDRQVAAWLLLCAAVIFGMILLGGVTRLTHSGLSMVEWKPLVGVIPPFYCRDNQLGKSKISRQKSRYSIKTVGDHSRFTPSTDSDR